MNPDVLIIGVDAGDYTTINRLRRSGRIPNISRLIDSGFAGILESSVPPWTPTAWTSLTTGTNPGKHGIFDFKMPDQSRLINRGDIRSNQIWDYLTAAGKRSIVVNVPVTHPAPEINGVLVPGYLGPEVNRSVAQPDDIISEIRDAIGSYRVYKRDGIDTDEELCEEYLQLMQMRLDAVSYLCQQYESDFAMVQFQRTDTVFHELPERKYIDQVYSKLDEIIGELTETVDADTTLVVSDHGMDETGEWDFRINTWLREQGYLNTSPDGYRPGWKKPAGDQSENSGITKTLMSTAADFGLTAPRVERLLKRLCVADIVRSALPQKLLADVVAAGGEGIDKQDSLGYCPSGPGLGVYCDNKVREEIKDKLQRVKDPDGKYVFDQVEFSEDIFDGPEATSGPDILALPRGMQYFISATVSVDVFDQSEYEYNHMPEGICIAEGANVVSGDGTVGITQIAPAVLALLNVKIATEFDGNVPREVFPDIEVPKSHSYEMKTIENHEEDQKDVEERLEELGYFS